MVEAAAPTAAASVVRIRTISGVEVRLEPELFISLLSCVPASTRRLTISGVALGLVSRLGGCSAASTDGGWPPREPPLNFSLRRLRKPCWEKVKGKMNTFKHLINK